MEEPKKLLVSESSVETLRKALAEERAINTDHASDYLNGYANGIDYALKVLGLGKEAKS